MSSQPGRPRWNLLIAAVFFVAARTAVCQPAQPSNGLRLESVGVSSTYFAEHVPQGIIAPGDVFLGSDEAVTTGANVRWLRTGSRSLMNIDYFALYGTRLQNSALKSWNQSGSFILNRRLGNKWTLNGSVSGEVMNFDESLFNSSGLSKIASSGASFDDTVAAVRGQTNDPVLASAGGLKPDRTAEKLLFGRRIATAGGQVGLSYARSSRLTIAFNAGGSHIRHLNDASDIVGFAYPQITSKTLGVNVTYAMSPRTQIGFGVSAMRSSSTDSVTNSGQASMSLNRTLSRRWFVAGSLGRGSSNAASNSHQTITYSAGLGFKTFRYTLLAAYDRSITDPFIVAIGNGHINTLTAAWHYNQPGSSWWLDSMFSQVHAVFTGVPTTNTWTATETFGHNVTSHFAVLFQYTAGVGARRYIQAGRQYQLEQTAFRVSFVWSPQAGRMR
jgi:hypothetical protein